MSKFITKAKLILKLTYRALWAFSKGNIFSWAKSLSLTIIVKIFLVWIVNIIEIIFYDEHSMEDSGYMDMKLSKYK